MLSQKAKYAMRALLYLAKAQSAEPVGIAEIAAKQAVPRKFLELILLELKRNGFVQSFRGKHGGYALAKAPEEIHFGEVIRLIDGPLAALPCASLTAYRRCVDCEDEATCVIRRILKQVRDASSSILDRTSLSDVLDGRAGELIMGDGI
ncbi:Rrf2 family transcriptional regulator [Dongia sp.]|jgi:Rrf2 family protein|uniref:RrF2 family transcriptional regulator n=1 Tax=Dongia sp. TaxID=1977262 RepID=UPI0035AF6D39